MVEHCAGAGSVAAYISQTAYGTEEMHFMFNAAAHELSVTQGIHIDPNMDQFYEFTPFHLALANVWCVGGANPCIATILA